MNINQKAVNALRILSADQIQKANSGHPGLPLGAAPAAYELWANHMNHNPKNPNWSNRDRFILSAGHGSALLYSLLHMFGYEGMTIDELKNFRQFGHLTPGHPEYGHTIGVESTTGPLGAGVSTAVGMAMAESHLASVFNRDGYPVVDHYTFAMTGDGCLMEGVAYEALSLAGTLKLDKLIVMYDSNDITIEGDTSTAFKEDVAARFKAFGFQVQIVEDGNDIESIGKAIENAKADKERPSLIICRTQIGYGCPAKVGKASAHGEPLGEENVKELRKFLGWENENEFEVSSDIYSHYKKIADINADKEARWTEMFERYCNEFPELKEKWNLFHGELDTNKLEDEAFWSYETKAMATRATSGDIINKLKDMYQNLIGGSADLAPSNKTEMKGEGFFSPENRSGRNIHFGVREMAMTAITNGLYLHGGLKPFCATFFVFSDFMKPMIRLAALMGLPVAYVLTHDSIGVGEDGPTHEPVEQLAMLRTIPNLNVFRPADYTETAVAWASAIKSKSTPTALVLTRQNLPQLEGSSREAEKGAYVLSEASNKENIDLIIMASGSEVELAINAKVELEKEGYSVRVVSVPCMDLFEIQSCEYKEFVLPSYVKSRLAVEAGSTMPWFKYVGLEGDVIGMTSFGASAPAGVLFKHFGFTTENVVEKAKNILKK
ncbi:transketolase [Peptostreptococcus canis]|uniref:Transketolase n=1 Tax=Peptostreptococcus canis TaxID=1159213 RepID=A0ABR6TMV8_9FIRM|nr:transketolase [Peptostreptococcus canis]MBC2576749.1 transketolase [Peptostreptococcus canis]MBP1998848.1 transketolase [Peptostreptococcus canis]